jgi:Lrp/AsnC family transcriptional regulator, leucine-responsive regulatory protein
MPLLRRINEEAKQTNVTLDLRDQSIISLLSEHARMPLSEIAKKTHLNRDTVNYRIKRLQDLGVIQAMYPHLDMRHFGFEQYQVFFVLDERDKKAKQACLQSFIDHPHTCSVIVYNDRWDVHWTLIARSLTEFDHILTGVINLFAGVIIEKEVFLVLRKYHTTTLPYDHYQKKGCTPRAIPVEKKEISLDAKDIAIVQELSLDARKNAVAIGSAVGLSGDAVLIRMKRLYDMHVVHKYTVIADYAKLGYHLFVFPLRVKAFDEKHNKRLETYVKDHPFIVRCVKTIGSYDFLLYIVADTPRSLHHIIEQIKDTFSDVIVSYATWVTYKELCFYTFPRVLRK